MRPLLGHSVVMWCTQAPLLFTSEVSRPFFVGLRAWRMTPLIVRYLCVLPGTRTWSVECELQNALKAAGHSKPAAIAPESRL